MKTSTIEKIAQALIAVQEATAIEETRRKHPRAPTITISREVGVLGTTIARALGERLGWEVYDKELIETIARSLEAPPSDVKWLDERTVSWLEEQLTGFLSSQTVNSYSYLKYLIASVEGLGELGSCIIVGRGANCILPPESTLRVRLVGTLEDRIRVMAKRHNTTEKAVVKLVEKTEASRLEFVRRNFGRDPEDPHEYDLVLNTSRLTVESCVETIVGALRQFANELIEID